MARLNVPALRRALHSKDYQQVLEALGTVSMAGPRALVLQDEVEALLEHEEGWVREDAIRLLARTWGLPEHRATARRLAHDDPDPEVAVTAICCLGWIYIGTGDPVVICELVALLHDITRPSAIAAQAYMALQKVNDLPAEERCEQVLIFDCEDFHLIDRDFVARVTERATARRRFDDAPGEPLYFQPTIELFGWDAIYREEDREEAAEAEDKPRPQGRRRGRGRRGRRAHGRGVGRRT